MKVATSFWGTNLGKTIKAAAWVALSSALAYLVTVTTGDSSVFGPATILINTILVFIQKTWFSKSTPNVG